MSAIAAFSEKKYKRLLSLALPCAIHNDEEYGRLHAILAEIEHKAAVRELAPEEERLSDLLFALIEPYEQKKSNRSCHRQRRSNSSAHAWRIGNSVTKTSGLSLVPEGSRRKC